MGGMAGMTETMMKGMTGATAPQASSGGQAQALQAYEQNAARQQAQYAQERAQGAQLQQGVQQMRQMQQGARMPWQESYNAGLQKAQGVPYQPQQMQQYQPPMQQYQPPMQQMQYNSHATQQTAPAQADPQRSKYDAYIQRLMNQDAARLERDRAQNPMGHAIGALLAPYKLFS
jgi:hypothetical protein